MKNEILRHSIASIVYRFEKVIKNQEDSFGEFGLGSRSRTANEIINHMFDVLHATRVFIEEERFIKESSNALSFSEEASRFKAECELIDRSLSHEELPVPYVKRLIQGPVSDIFTHIGQLSMMSRLNGRPKDWEDFSSAPINKKS